MLRVPAVAVAALGLLGCGGGDEDRPAAPRAVAVTLTGSGAQTGPPDAGTAGGHGADLVVTASASSHVLRGTARPADAAVSIRPRAGGQAVAADVVAGGRFTARLRALRAGANDFVLTARKEGYRAWTRTLRVVRR